MKLRSRFVTIVALGLFSISVASSCTIFKVKNRLPPGQEKKITGQQSAAPFAPGHN
ncbi:MAG: hypothetical protein ACYC1A_08615 [Spirochaetales bacterium]